MKRNPDGSFGHFDTFSRVEPMQNADGVRCTICELDPHSQGYWPPRVTAEQEGGFRTNTRTRGDGGYRRPATRDRTESAGSGAETEYFSN